jgi:hypothetical protein
VFGSDAMERIQREQTVVIGPPYSLPPLRQLNWWTVDYELVLHRPVGSIFSCLRQS